MNEARIGMILASFVFVMFCNNRCYCLTILSLRTVLLKE